MTVLLTKQATNYLFHLNEPDYSRIIETDLTAEEKAIIAEGRAQFRDHPEDFVPLETLRRE
jgi:hypothetical protein